MALEPREIVVPFGETERTFRATPLPGLKVFELQSQVAGLVAPLFAVREELSVQTVGNVCQSLSAEKLKWLLSTFVVGNVIEIRDGMKVPVNVEYINSTFAGDIWPLWLLLYKVLEINYRSFFEGLVATVAKRAPELKDGTSPEDEMKLNLSIGGSGE